MPDVDLLLDLRPPARPSMPAPRLLRCLLPDPSRHDGWRRYRHEDLGELSPSARRWEAQQIRVRAALVDEPDAQVPLWLIERLALLEGAA